MWFGVLIRCIILMGDFFRIHCNSAGVDKKGNFSFEYLWNALWSISKVSYLPSNSATSFLIEFDGNSLETSSLLKFELWRVSVSINCNFSRYLDQVSHSNNQPLPFFNFLTWYEVWICTMDIPLTEEIDFSQY